LVDTGRTSSFDGIGCLESVSDAEDEDVDEAADVDTVADTDVVDPAAVDVVAVDVVAVDGDGATEFGVSDLRL
jgi:hypothetical protein